MKLSRLLPWNWFAKPAPKPAAKPCGLAVQRAPEEEGDWPDPDSPDCISYELDRLFDHAFSGFGFSAPHLQAACGRASPTVPPRTRMSGGPEGYILEADLPGVREQDISLTLKGRELTVLAPRLADRSDGSSQGRAAYRATFRLECDTDPEVIQASFQGFLLIIQVPRPPGTSSSPPACE